MDKVTLDKANELQGKMNRLVDTITKYHRYGARTFALAYRSDTMDSRDSYNDLPQDKPLSDAIYALLEKRLVELGEEFEQLTPPALDGQHQEA